MEIEIFQKSLHENFLRWKTQAYGFSLNNQHHKKCLELTKNWYKLDYLGYTMVKTHVIRVYLEEELNGEETFIESPDPFKSH